MSFIRNCKLRNKDDTKNEINYLRQSRRLIAGVPQRGGSVVLNAKMHISDELACHPFKLDGFILTAHKIAQHKTSYQLPPSSSDLCESCALVRYQPRCF